MDSVPFDAGQVQSEIADGKSLTEVAAKYGIARSTLTRRLKGKNGSAATTSGNGHASHVEALAITEVEKILECYWTRLPVVERLRILLERRAAN
jgi:hypothetical protein